MDTRCEVQSLNRALRSSTCRMLRSSRRRNPLYQLPSAPPPKIHLGRRTQFHGFSNGEVIESTCKLNALHSIVKIEPTSPESEQSVDRYWLRNGSKNKNYVETPSSSPEVLKQRRRRSSRKDKKDEELPVQFIKVESNDKFEQVGSSNSNNDLKVFTKVESSYTLAFPKEEMGMEISPVFKRSPEFNSPLKARVKMEPDDIVDILSCSPSRQTPVLNSCFEVNSPKTDKLIQIKSADLNNNDFRKIKTDPDAVSNRAYGKRSKPRELICVSPVVHSMEISPDIESVPKPLISIGETSFSNLNPELICIGVNKKSTELNCLSVDVSDGPMKNATNTVVNSDFCGFDDIYILDSPNIDLDSIVSSIQEHIEPAVLKKITDDLFCDGFYLNSMTPVRCSNKDSIVPNSDNSACTSPETFFLDIEEPFNSVMKNDDAPKERIGITSSFLEVTGDSGYYENDSHCEVNKNYKNITDQMDQILLELTNEKLVPYATGATSTYSTLDTMSVDDLDIVEEVIKEDMEITAVCFNSDVGSVKFAEQEKNLNAHQRTDSEELVKPQQENEILNAEINLNNSKENRSHFQDNFMHCFRQLILSDNSPPSISEKTTSRLLEPNLTEAGDSTDGVTGLPGAKTNNAGHAASEPNIGEPFEPSNEGFAAAFALSLQSLYEFDREYVSPLNDEKSSSSQTDNSEECTLMTIGDYVSPIPSHIEKSFYMSPTIRELDMTKFAQYFDFEKIKKSNDPELEFSKQLGKCEAIDKALNLNFRRRQKMGLAPPDPSWQVNFVKRLKREQRNLEREAASRQFKKKNSDGDDDEDDWPRLNLKRRGRKRKISNRRKSAGESSGVAFVKKRTDKKMKKTETCTKSTKSQILKTEGNAQNRAETATSDKTSENICCDLVTNVNSKAYSDSPVESSCIEAKPCDTQQNIGNEKTDKIVPIPVPKKTHKTVSTFKVPFKTNKVEPKKTETESRYDVTSDRPSLLRKSLSKDMEPIVISFNSNEESSVLEPSDEIMAKWKSFKLKVSTTNPSLNLPAAMNLLGKTGLIDRDVAMKALTLHAQQEFKDLKSTSLKTKRESTSKLEKDLLWKNCAILLQHGDWRENEEVLKTLMEAMATIPVNRDTILSNVATIKTIIETSSSKNKNVADAATTLLHHLGPAEEILPFLFMNH